MAGCVAMEVGSDAPRNALAQSRSPYLLQHAGNPVEWHEWGEEAFALAKERDAPIFLSIGYSTCHWCHVMAHESFEDEATAAKMNRGFVNIKVDREERPDVDRIYMAFVQMTTGSGGWPMSVWLTPDLKPFYGGTYFPPRSQYGKLGFPQLLDRISEAWQERRTALTDSGRQFVETLGGKGPASEGGSEDFDWVTPERCLKELADSYDEQWGGFGSAPKFPIPSSLNFLLEMAEARGGDPLAARMLGGTLDRMADGGIRDFLAGGFHRYSVDRYWHAPHFEKMLYDQGQLAEVYADSGRLLGRMDDLVVAEEIVGYVGEQLASGEGGLFSAEDADSPLPEDPERSGEGAFYVWTAKEVEKLLEPREAALFREVFDIRKAGNVRRESDPHGEFEGKNILMRVKSASEAAAGLSIEAPQAEAMLSSSLGSLKAIRALRPRPHLDDKVLASWNAMMISGACRVYQIGGNAKALRLAEEAGRFLVDRLFDAESNTLYRSYRIERGNTKGFAEDYASASLAFVDLYESTGDVFWLQRAERFLDILIERFWDEEGGGFFASQQGDDSLIVRLKEDYDGAEPSANSQAALALLRVGWILGEERFESYGRRTLEAFRHRWSRSPRSMPLMLVAVTRMLRPAQRIVIAGKTDCPTAQAMRATAFLKRKRHSLLICLDGAADWLMERNPLLASFRPVGDETVAYLCEDYACRVPVRDAEALADQLFGGARAIKDAL